MKYKSIAEWGDFTTEDTHDTQDQAESVCRILERDGFGGQGKVFPKSTRVEPVDVVAIVCTDQKLIALTQENIDDICDRINMATSDLFGIKL
jgi:hypothetical protein